MKLVQREYDSPNLIHKTDHPFQLGLCAHGELVGSTARGLDGNLWQVKEDKNGRKRWVKIGTAVSKKKSSVTKKTSVKKATTATKKRRLTEVTTEKAAGPVVKKRGIDYNNFIETIYGMLQERLIDQEREDVLWLSRQIAGVILDNYVVQAKDAE